MSIDTSILPGNANDMTLDASIEPEVPAIVRSNDGVEIPTTVKAVMQANVMRTMYDDLTEEAASTPIPWDVTEPITRLTLAWCEHHRNDETIDAPGLDIPQHRKQLKKDDVPEWDKKFLDGIELDDVCLLFNASDYLEIPDLMTYCAINIATRTTGKSTEEYRELFGIVNDWAPGEEEALRRQNAWAMDI
ncbi:E3 ubiquitin ligase complex SCF subunit scon-3 [Xylariaceae sp. FL1272]|nr:E3 ubiquitin ligase complex SCF subunit scon-3 [Xylariaceae sp. FL1272]